MGNERLEKREKTDWNKVEKSYTVGFNKISVEGIEAISRSRHRSPESLIREVISRYLQRVKRCNAKVDENGRTYGQ